MKTPLRNIFLSTLLLFLQCAAFAQPKHQHHIKGWVYDAKTLDPLPYTNLILKAEKTGTITAHDGSFDLVATSLPDSLMISAIGYFSQTIYLGKKNHVDMQIALKTKDFELGEVVIRPGENPANRIMRNVIASKEENNPIKAFNYACNTYTKILINAVNDKDKQEQKERLIKTGLPIFFSEKLSQNIYQKDPFIEKGKILAEKQEGLGFLSEMNIIGYTNNMSLDINFYKNTIEIIDKPFLSPLNNRAFLYYKFYLTDSLITEFGKEYILEYKPKNSRDLAFTGHMKIADETWAITEIVAKLPLTANLNYVNKLEFRQTFVPINDTLTFFKTNETTAELKLVKDNALINLDFTGKMYKKSVYSDIQINFPSVLPGEEENIWSVINPVTPKMKNKDIIGILRPESLSMKETSAILTIDSLNNSLRIRSVDALTRMFITGYIPGDYLELGPYLELIKNNKVEGLRYTFAARTSADFTKNMMIYGHVGYGTRDNDWKYGAGVQYKFKTDSRKIAGFEYRDDLSKIGDNRSIFLIKENMMVTGEDNVIASIFTSDPLDKLSREVRYTASYENEWKPGVSTTTTLNHRTIYTGRYMPFIHNQQLVDHFSVNEATLGLRLSWNENYSDTYCRRYYMTTSYPIINLRITGGQYRLENNQNEYLNLRGVINHDINWGQTKIEYIAEAGITLGTVPFPLLEIHRTDQSLGYALYSFNMMNEMEFAADRFVNLFAQHHLNGLIFNRIPLFKYLGIREVFSAKLLWSHLGTKHETLLQYPKNLYDARYIPYTELSVGAENLFQYFRIDFIWRMSYLENPGINPVGFRARFDVNF